MIGKPSKYRHARTLLLCSATALIVPGATILGASAVRAATPIDTSQPFYLQSDVGTTVLPDFQGGTLLDNRNGVTDSNNYTVENFSTNTIDAFGNATIFAGTFSGAGPLTITDSVGGGVVAVTGASAIGGTVTIDPGATMQWGNANPAFLIGSSGGVVDNGALVMNFGGGGVAGTIPISGTGTVEMQSGAFNNAGVSTYTGTTTIDAAGFFALSAGGSISDSSNVIDNGIFDISGTTAGTSITTLSGSGQVSVGSQTLTLTAASGTFSGVIQDAGFFAGTGGGLTIAGGTETLTGTNTYTGPTTIDLGATLVLGNGGTTGTVAGNIVDNGLVQFNYGGSVVDANTFSGAGAAEVVAGTAVITGASAIGGTVTIDPGATMQWGNSNPAFLIGSSGGVVDNGALVMNYGGGGVAGTIPISGTGTVEMQSGAFNNAGVSTYTGTTTIDAAGFFALSAGGSISNSSNIIDNGIFDISGTTAGTSITTLSGSGQVSVGSQTLTLTAASGTFSGVIQDVGFFAGTGGGLTIAGGTETLTGTNTFTGPTTIDLGATLVLGNGGTTGTVAGNVVDNGLVQFNYGGSVVDANTFSGTGAAEVMAGTAVVTGASAIGGTVTIDPGATMQWGNANPAFLIGSSGGVVDNGALVMNYGGGGVAGTIPISGTGTVEMQSGAFNNAGVSTYTGTTTIDAAGFFALSAGGSISNSSNVIDNGIFDISGTTAGTSITTLSGSGQVSVGSQTLTLTAASDTFSGVIQDAGFFAGTGGGLTIAGGTETLTGTNTFTGPTMIDIGATLVLGNGGTTGTVAGNIVDNGLVQFNYGGSVVDANTFSGTGSAEVVAGTAVVTGASAIGGTVTIDPGATMQWGNGNAAFLVGGSNNVVDNGALVMNYGGGGVAGTIAISGTGTVEMQSGAFNDAGVSTYTGTTTIDAAGFFALSAGGSISDSSNVIDNGIFDISGETAGTSITTLSGSGQVSVGSQTLTLTAASGTFSGVIQDAGFFAGTGGGLTIAGGKETLTGTNTYTGPTMIDLGATLQLGNGGTTGTVAGNIVDNGLVQFNYGGSVVDANTFSGTGSAEVVAGTAVFTGASAIGGTVTIDPGATMQWGNGNAAFLVGGSNNVVDNGSLVTDFGGGGVSGAIAISGTGSVTIQSGAFNDSAMSTYTGATTIDTGGFLELSGTGSIASSSGVTDNGTFDISGTTAGASITTLTGFGTVSLGGLTLTLTDASDLFSGVIADGGFFGGTGGGLTIASGTETLSGKNTYSGPTKVNAGATLALRGTGSIADSSGVTDSGTFDISGTTAGASITTISGSGIIWLGGQTLTLTNASGTFSGTMRDGGLSGGTGGSLIIAGGTETLSGTNSYSGGTTIENGELVVGNSSALGTGLVTMDAGTTLGFTGGNFTLANAFAISGDPTFNVPTGTSQTITGVIADGGTPGTLALTGGGTLTLTNTDTYTGATTTDIGSTLALSGTGGIADSSGVTDNGTLDISQTTAGASITTLTGSGTVSLGGQTLTLTNASDTFSGVIADGGLAGGAGGGVTVAGGTETLSGKNTYSGPTKVNPGATLALRGTGSIAASSGVTSNGTFDISGTSAGASITMLAGNGAVSLGGQTLTLTNASGTFSGTIQDGGISGGAGGSLTIAGGTQTLSGANTYSGPTSVNAGTLNVTGSIASSAVTVNTGATLAGNGTVGATTIASGGIIAPGAPYGTLTVAGNTTFVSGSTLQDQVDAAGETGTIGGTGMTTINGGTVQVITAAGTYAPVQDYTLIDTTGGVTGTFSSLTGNSLSNYDATLIYGPDTVTLRLLQNNLEFGTSYGTTPNQVAVGQAVSAAGVGNPIYLALANLAGSTPSAVPAALDSLSGEIHASLLSSMIEDDRMIRDTVLDRLADSDAQGIALWGAGFGDFGHIGGDANAASVHRDDNGGIVGLDVGLMPGMRAGLAGAFTGQTIDVSARTSKADGTSDHLIAYANWNASPFVLSLGVDHGWGSNNVVRNVAVLSETEADHQSNDTTQVFGDAGYRFVTSQSTIEPYIDLAWVEAKTGAFAETGGNDALSGGGNSDHETYATFGVRTALNVFSLGGVSVTPRASAAWQHAFSTFTPDEALALAGATQTYSISGVPLANNSAETQVGLDFAVMPQLVVSVGYDGEFGSTVQSSAVDGRIKWTF